METSFFTRGISLIAVANAFGMEILQRHQLSGAIVKRSRNRTGIAGNRQDLSSRFQCFLLGDRYSGRNAVANHDFTARNLAMAVDGRRMRNGQERRFNSTSLTVCSPAVIRSQCSGGSIGKAIVGSPPRMMWETPLTQRSTPRTTNSARGSQRSRSRGLPNISSTPSNESSKGSMGRANIVASRSRPRGSVPCRTLIVASNAQCNRTERSAVGLPGE